MVNFDHFLAKNKTGLSIKYLQKIQCLVLMIAAVMMMISLIECLFLLKGFLGNQMNDSSVVHKFPHLKKSGRGQISTKGDHNCEI